MNVLWVLAHPEPKSLSGSLCEEGIRVLSEAGHACRTSDLYAMKWKAALDRDDFSDDPTERCIPAERLIIPSASKRAYASGRLSADIRAEQEKLDCADTLILQFPLWWYGMPAILKGWFDRVFVKGYAYGIADPECPERTLRYGEGMLTGKRALVVVTTGSPRAALGPRGINGHLEHVLFPLLHGTLWYTGMSVLPPIAIYGADRLTQEQYEAAAAQLRNRVASIEDTAPLQFRRQNDSDYDGDLVLRPDLASGSVGLGVHYVN